MIRYWRKALALGCLLPALLAGAQRTDLNAFLDTHVSSTAQLVRQVKTRADVRDRYMRHYGMTEIQLCSYLATLRLQSLTHSEVDMVYSVPRSGAVKVHRQLLRKGDLVFVDPTGRAVLLARCGNPLELGPTNALNMSLAMPSLEASDVLAMTPLPNANFDPVMMIDPRPMISMSAPPDTLADVVSAMPPVTTTVVTAPTVPPITAPPPTVLAPPAVGGGNQRGILGILPLLGGGVLLGILAPHHGGGTVAPPPATPEPAGVVFLTLGALALRKRRRN